MRFLYGRDKGKGDITGCQLVMSPLSAPVDPGLRTAGGRAPSPPRRCHPPDLVATRDEVSLWEGQRERGHHWLSISDVPFVGSSGSRAKDGRWAGPIATEAMPPARSGGHAR